MGFDVDKFPGGLAYAKLSQVKADAGFVSLAMEQDDGTGTSTKRLPMVTSARHLAVGLSTKLFDYSFNAASQNTGIWKYQFTTLTFSQSAGALLMNSASTATGSTGAVLSSWRFINFPGNGVVRCEIETLLTSSMLTNQRAYLGMFPAASTTSVPTDGVYFKLTSAGLQGCVNFNGTETVGSFTGTMPVGTSVTLKMDISNGGVDYWIDGQLIGTLTTPAANGEPCAFAALPVAMQFTNSGTVSGSPMGQLKVANVTVTQRDIATEKLWENQQAGSGLIGAQAGEGATMGSTALYTNSLAAGAGAAMTNTTAALGSGLGGQFTAQPTLTAGTDGIVWSYQCPAGSVNQPPRTLFIKGISIQGMVSAALTGGPVLFAYALAFGHTAVSLATAEAASFANNTTKAARRIPLGFETYAATAAAGVLGVAAPIQIQFAVPIPVNPGEFVALTAKNLGTVTSAGTITILSRVDSFWE